MGFYFMEFSGQLRPCLVEPPPPFSSSLHSLQESPHLLYKRARTGRSENPKPPPFRRDSGRHEPPLKILSGYLESSLHRQQNAQRSFTVRAPFVGDHRAGNRTAAPWKSRTSPSSSSSCRLKWSETVRHRSEEYVDAWLGVRWRSTRWIWNCKEEQLRMVI